jgi:hypothetical protein
MVRRSALRVLITNFTLTGRSGSELYAAEVAEALIARGHAPVLYTPSPGRLARELQARAIPVTSDLRTIAEPPDILHGQHTHEMITALLAFPGIPAVQVHHGWVEAPPVAFPRIRLHVAVDDTVRERLVSEFGIPPERIEVIRNFVDPRRLPPRGPLPPRPLRALVFSNSADHHIRPVRAACAAHGIQVDAAGADVGRVMEDPGAILGRYDVVFAKARCAMEALATGAAVVLCDRAGLGPMVRAENFDELRRLNFGLRTLRAAITPEAVAQRLAEYDAADAALVSARMRSEGRIDVAIDQLIDVYERVTSEWRESGRDDPAHELRCAAAYLQRITSEPPPRVAAGALLKDSYFRLRTLPGARWLLPRPAAALRMYRAIRRT